jgi:hypothetical protein
MAWIREFPHTDPTRTSRTLCTYVSPSNQFESVQLESYVEQLGIEDYYAELRGIRAISVTEN